MNPVLNPNSDEFLSPEERVRMRRMLMFPEEFPPEFKNWLLDYMGVNGEIQRSQIRGLLQATPNYAQNTGSVNVTFTSTYVDASPVGPELTGLAKGLYLVTFGSNAQNQESGVVSWISLSVNGATSTTATALYWSNVFASANSISVPLTRAVLIELTEPSNSIKMQYARTAGGATGAIFTNRWIVAQRVAEGG
jgi:hypothetical protein